MNKLDEIALRVADNGIGRVVSNVDICDFARALLAELSKDAGLEESNDVLSSENTNLQGRVDILIVKLAAEQSKVKVLTDAATLAADQIRKSDYTPARSTLLVALATVKGE